MKINLPLIIQEALPIFADKKITILSNVAFSTKILKQLVLAQREPARAQTHTGKALKLRQGWRLITGASCIILLLTATLPKHPRLPGDGENKDSLPAVVFCIIPEANVFHWHHFKSINVLLSPHKFWEFAQCRNWPLLLKGSCCSLLRRKFPLVQREW